MTDIIYVTASFAGVAAICWGGLSFLGGGRLAVWKWIEVWGRANVAATEARERVWRVEQSAILTKEPVNVITPL